MPEIDVGGARLHYTDTGQGEETVVFSHSYLVDSRHFAPQIDTLSSRYRVIAYDHRGHGGSSKHPGRCSMEDIYADGVAFLDALGLGPVHFVGLSTGGFVGMRIAYRRPDLLRSLVLMDTSAAREPLLNRVKYELFFAVVKRFGTRPLVGEGMKAMFGPAFLRDPARAEQRELWRARLIEGDVPALIAFGHAIFARDDVAAHLKEIDLPTLVVVGERDRSTPVARARQLAAEIPGAHLEVIPRAGHLCTVEEPALVNEALLRFLSDC